MGITITILIVAALIAGYTDLRSRRIPNWLTAAMVTYGLAFHSHRAGWNGVLLSLGGLVLGLGLMLIPYLLRGLGAGDVKFLAAVGSIVGVPGVLMVFALATALGAIMGTVALSRARKPRIKDRGSWIVDRGSASESRITNHESRNAVAIPYGIALSFGTLLFTGGLLIVNGSRIVDRGSWIVDRRPNHESRITNHELTQRGECYEQEGTDCFELGADLWSHHGCGCEPGAQTRDRPVFRGRTGQGSGGCQPHLGGTTHHDRPGEVGRTAQEHFA